MNVADLWHLGSESQWNSALMQYWNQVKPQNMALEKAMHVLNPATIQSMTTDAFYEWLNTQYFVWKYTEANRLKTTQTSLHRHRDTLEEWEKLARTHTALFQMDVQDIRACLKTTEQGIHGLGIAGASGLLALLYPKYFGTVDKFVLIALRSVPDLPLPLPDPDKAISLTVGANLIQLFRRKAEELNTRFQTSEWTPRKIDMVLWGIRDS